MHFELTLTVVSMPCEGAAELVEVGRMVAGACPHRSKCTTNYQTFARYNVQTSEAVSANGRSGPSQIRAEVALSSTPVTSTGRKQLAVMNSHVFMVDSFVKTPSPIWAGRV